MMDMLQLEGDFLLDIGISEAYLKKIFAAFRWNTNIISKAFAISFNLGKDIKTL